MIKNEIKKPAWLVYAGEVREQLANLKDTKSGKRTERHLWLTYLNARETKGYAGSLADWHYLLRIRPRR